MIERCLPNPLGGDIILSVTFTRYELEQAERNPDAGVFLCRYLMPLRKGLRQFAV